MLVFTALQSGVLQPTLSGGWSEQSHHYPPLSELNTELGWTVCPVLTMFMVTLHYIDHGKRGLLVCAVQGNQNSFLHGWWIFLGICKKTLLTYEKAW